VRGVAAYGVLGEVRRPALRREESNILVNLEAGREVETVDE
jgi:hypothetical protein